MILRYKLCDFIKIHDDYVNDPMKGDFQKTLLLFHVRCRVAQSVEHSPANQKVKDSIPVSASSAYEYQRMSAINYWELMVDVALRFSKSMPRSRANEKGMDSLLARLIPTLGHPDQLTS